jgi:membrane-bound lytic murein transglycosylase D
MVIAAAWLYLHPREYGLDFPRVDTRPATLRLSQPASIYQLTICLGNRGEREGYMRALRNLNPRYEAESWLPAGATLNATTKIVGLYNRHCTQGKRAELARTLVMSNADSAIVRSTRGNIPPASGAVMATPVATGTPATVVPRDYRVQGGETLTAIARKFQCDMKLLAEANAIKKPRYNIRPGQHLKLEGCRQQ